ncbi:MAG TPA: hypothetical protein VNL69_13085 [Bacteroidota bacterium]|nr:hypothetical protein [Bacteroidota bacterium]
MRTYSLLLILLAIILAPFTFGIATTPKILWHQYVVAGTLERASGLSRENFTVVLAGRIGSEEYRRIRGNVRPSPSPVAITDTSGGFFISVSDAVRFDSVRIMIVRPDSLPVLGSPLAVSAAQVFTQYTTAEYTDPEGCNGCRTTGTTTVVDGYVYNFPEQRVVLPY